MFVSDCYYKRKCPSKSVVTRSMLGRDEWEDATHVAIMIILYEHRAHSGETWLAGTGMHSEMKPVACYAHLHMSVLMFFVTIVLRSLAWTLR